VRARNTDFLRARPASTMTKECERFIGNRYQAVESLTRPKSSQRSRVATRGRFEHRSYIMKVSARAYGLPANEVLQVDETKIY